MDFNIQANRKSCYINMSNYIKSFNHSNFVILNSIYRSKSQFDVSKSNIIHEIEKYKKAQYESMLYIYKYYLIEKIITKRKDAIKIIINAIRKYKNTIAIKRNIIIHKIMEQRCKCALLIQSNFRGFMVKKDLKVILSPINELIFFYTPPEHLIIDSSLQKIHMLSQNHKKISFSYSKTLDKYYILLKRTGKKKYKFNLIINNSNIIDSRYPVTENNKNGGFCNIITDKMMYKKEKFKFVNCYANEQKKFWENIFRINYYKRRKISIDTLSGNFSDFSAEMNSGLNDSDNSQRKAVSLDEAKIKKPILKKPKIDDNVRINQKEKRVSFSPKCEYFII